MSAPQGRIVVLGATGFVGAAVAARLEERGARVVRAGRTLRPGVVRADLTDPASLRRVLEPGDLVVNCAGYADATDRSPAGRERFRRVNVEGVRALAEACIARGSSRLVHLSSVAAMGALRGPGVTEEARGPLATPYAASKRAGEEVLARYEGELPFVVLRPTSVFGEGRGLAAALCRAVDRPLLPLPAGGRARIPFTYVGNVAEAVALSLSDGIPVGRAFIVGDERSYPLREVVEELADALGARPRLLGVPVPAARAGVAALEALAALRGGAPALDRARLRALTESVEYDIGAFRAATGFRPPHSLHDAAARIAAWYRKESRAALRTVRA